MDFDTWKRRPGPATLSALLVSVEGRVQRICRRILRNDHDADEARQEVLLEIAKGLESVEDGARFDRWVGTVAFRTALDRRRMRLRREAREREAAGRPPNGSHRDDALHEAMARLIEDEHELLIERYFDRRTLRDMGQRRGVSAVAVRKQIAKARGRLKRILGVGGVVLAGASIVKAKTAAILAIILVPLLLLGGGVWVTAVKQSRQIAAAPPTLLARDNSEPLAEGDIDALIPSPVTASTIPLDTTLLRSEIIASWRRLRYAKARAAECKRTWPEATTDEECRRLVQEKAMLDKEAAELGKRLPELAAINPGLILEIARNARDLEARLSLLGLVAPEIDAEIASGGEAPLLKELLGLASGDSEEKTYLAAFATQLWHANADVGHVLVKLLAEEDFHVRMHAMQALHSLAQNGALR